MNASEALSRLKRLRVPAATTADAAAVLGVSGEAASHMLRRLARSGLVTPLRKGVWALADRPDPLALAEYVTTPYPSYLSLQTALYQHGMIEQIPSMIFLVSLARSGRVETGLGTYSVHHVQPAFFDGFESLPDSGIKLAAPEKALVPPLPPAVSVKPPKSPPSPARLPMVSFAFSCNTPGELTVTAEVSPMPVPPTASTPLLTNVAPE